MKTYFKCYDEDYKMEYVSNESYLLPDNYMVRYNDEDYYVYQSYLDLERNFNVIELRKP